MRVCVRARTYVCVRECWLRQNTVGVRVCECVIRVNYWYHKPRTHEGGLVPEPQEV